MKKRNNVKEQTKLSFQLGGTTPMPGTGIINTPANAPTTGFKPYVAPTVPGFTTPQLQNVQFTQAPQTTNLPTFGQVMGSNLGKYDELRRYVNDAGQVRQIPFKNGKPIYPIPEGFRFEAMGMTTPTDTSTTPVTVTGQQQDDGGGDGAGTGVSGSVQGPASSSTGLAGVQSALSGITGYFSGAPAQAQPYGGTTLSGLTNLGTITDFSNNISGVQDALGVYGTGPINLGIVGNMLMGNPLGALASASGIGFGPTEAFGQAAPTGHGAFSTADLDAYATGKMSKAQQNELGISMNQNQAQARAEVQRAIGTEITGIMGYKAGDISPITGTPVNSKGRVVNYKGSSTGVDAGFETMGGWVDAMQASVDTGYYGGPLSKAEVANLSEKGKKGYAAKAKALGYNEQGEGPPGSGGPTAEANSFGTPPGGTGKGRSDYTGGNAGTPSDNAADDDMGDDGVGGGASTGSSSSSGGHGMGDGTSGVGDDDGDEAYCLTEDMKVKRNGIVDFVTNIKVGDMIDNYKVKEVLHKHMRSGYYAINNELKISNDHPVLANGTWTRPEDLVVGDSINGIPVTSLEYVERMTPTVSIVIDGESFDVHTENNIYTVHGRYKEVRQEAA